jgi:hypothetical protein
MIAVGCPSAFGEVGKQRKNNGVPLFFLLYFVRADYIISGVKYIV